MAGIVAESEAWMTIQDVARSEGISERQAQRYCRAPGYKGHVLPATRKGRGFVIGESDYRAWRVECGFDFLPQQDAAPERSTHADPAPESGSPADAEAASPGEPRPTYPPWPQVANPGGPITNVPHPTSGSMPHPQACADYFAEQARKMDRKLRGYSDDNE
jgi:hypothetical protein